MNKGNIKECKLVESMEISPIKILSHSSNKIVETSPNCTLFEVHEENSDKENESVPCKAKKVYVPSRYKCNSLKQKQENKIDSNKVNSKDIHCKNFRTNHEFKKGFGPSLGQKTNNCKLLKNPEISNSCGSQNKLNKCSLPKNSLETKCRDIDGAEDNQQIIDIAYCQYLQALYLKEHFKQLIDIQELKFEKHYRELRNEEKLLSISMDSMKITENLKLAIKEREYVMKKLAHVFDLSGLQVLLDRLDLCSNLVEVDSSLEIETLDNDKLSLLKNYIENETIVNNEDIVKVFSDLNSNLTEVNGLMQMQKTEFKNIKELSVDILSKILSSVSDTML